MHITGFLHPHHLCHLRNQHEPEFEEPIGPHRKIKKAKALPAVSDHPSGHEVWGESALGPVMCLQWTPGKDQSLPAGLAKTWVKGECFSSPCNSLFAGPLQIG